MEDVLWLCLFCWWQKINLRLLLPPRVTRVATCNLSAQSDQFPERPRWERRTMTFIPLEQHVYSPRFHVLLRCYVKSHGHTREIQTFYLCSNEWEEASGWMKADRPEEAAAFVTAPAPRGFLFVTLWDRSGVTLFQSWSMTGWFFFLHNRKRGRCWHGVFLLSHTLRFHAPLNAVTLSKAGGSETAEWEATEFTTELAVIRRKIIRTGLLFQNVGDSDIITQHQELTWWVWRGMLM